MNAGGIISVSAEYLGESLEAVDSRVRAIAPRTMQIIERARAERTPPHTVADRIVRERLAHARNA